MELGLHRSETKRREPHNTHAQQLSSYNILGNPVDQQAMNSPSHDKSQVLNFRGHKGTRRIASR